VLKRNANSVAKETLVSDIFDIVLLYFDTCCGCDTLNFSQSVPARSKERNYRTRGPSKKIHDDYNKPPCKYITPGSAARYIKIQKA
jgi:hypothetical protein